MRPFARTIPPTVRTFHQIAETIRQVVLTICRFVHTIRQIARGRYFSQQLVSPAFADLVIPGGFLEIHSVFSHPFLERRSQRLFGCFLSLPL
jgi:hypothetical protein